MKTKVKIKIWVAVNSDITVNSKIKENRKILGITPRLPKYHTKGSLASHLREDYITQTIKKAS